MAFVGIITDIKSETALKQLVEASKISKEISLIYITERNIDNIKNIKFETIILNKEFDNKQALGRLIKNAKNLIVNIDIEYDIEDIRDLSITVITYGFNSKSTITASSLEEETLICLQRNIKNRVGNIIEPQEIKAPITKNADPYDSMIFIAINLFYLK